MKDFVISMLYVNLDVYINVCIKIVLNKKNKKKKNENKINISSTLRT